MNEPLADGPLSSQGVAGALGDGLAGATTSQILATDSNGRLIPLVPTLGVDYVGSAGTVDIIGPPASGAWYLFGIDAFTTAAAVTQLLIEDGVSNPIAKINVPASGESHHVDLGGFRNTNGVYVNSAGSFAGTLRYAPGP